MNAPVLRPPGFSYAPMFPLGEAATPWRKLDIAGVTTTECDGRTVLRVAPSALTELAVRAFHDVSHLLRPGHLAQLRRILDDPEASANDRFVALDLLRNANIAAGGVLPMCQDTGTAIVFGKKGQRVWVDGNEEEALAYGVYRTFTETNLRYSQMAPLSMFEEVNTGSNLPVQFDILATPGEAHADEFHFMFVAKGGGSANKTFLFQETRAILNPEKLLAFVESKIRTLGTSACPPYHLAVVIGGTSAEATLKTVKLASCRWLDSLPTQGDRSGHAIRDPEMEARIHELTRNIGIGAQFGGKYFCHDVRVIRLPRHGASLPVGIGVSCSADRQILAKVTPEGVFLEELERDPAKYLPETTDDILGGNVVHVDLNRPMDQIRAGLSRYPRQDTPVAYGHAGRRARHRPRQAEGAAGSRRGSARLFQGSPDLLRRSRQDAGRLCYRQLRSHHGGPDGQLCGRVPAGERFDGDAGERQPIQGGARRLPHVRRLLPRQRRRRGGAAGAGLHPKGRGTGVPGAGDGGGMANRGGEFPGLHRDRR